MSVRRLYVEKRQGFDIPAQKLFADLKELFAIERLKASKELYERDLTQIFLKKYEFEEALKISRKIYKDFI